MKNSLECQVTSCKHNQNSLCALPSIRVDGPAACQCDQTCCESYEPRTQGSTNSTSGHAPSPETSIDCKACHCTYNDDCTCTADCVCVGCCCSDVTTKSGTECCTFRQG